MAVYLVAYDLKVPDKDYSSLVSTIESVLHCRAQQSVWFVETTHTGVTDVGNWLRPHMDVRDTLFIHRVTGDWAAFGPLQCAQWLKSRGL